LGSHLILLVDQPGISGRELRYLLNCTKIEYGGEGEWAHSFTKRSASQLTRRPALPLVCWIVNYWLPDLRCGAQIAISKIPGRELGTWSLHRYTECQRADTGLRDQSQLGLFIFFYLGTARLH